MPSDAPLISYYYDRELIERLVADGRHRDAVGGLWDEIGALQFEFLKARGLQTQHKLLDVGCGSLRGGVHFVRYLESNHYFGIDLNQTLLDAGYDREIAPAGLAQKLPRSNLHCGDNFDVESFCAEFDFALALSLFTHLPLNAIRVCIEKLANVVSKDGIFFASFFERPAGSPSHHMQLHSPGSVCTHGDADPYHCSLEDLVYVAKDLPWQIEYIGEFGHPRGQRMVGFRKMTGAAVGDSGRETRALDPRSALQLAAGSDHYRAYVGPPERFDFMSATQFALLFQLGLRDHHRVLDFGCGSLRLGRLLIPFLQAGCYHGIDPNRWLIEEGIDRELGRGAIDLKQPRFAYNDDFNCHVFGRTFDFIVAQSIITHTGPDLLRHLLATAAESMHETTMFLFSYIRENQPAQTPGMGWHYPGCVGYNDTQLDSLLDEAGLQGVALPWLHPGAVWHLAMRRDARMPSREDLSVLNGKIVNGRTDKI
jgi:SAM-dependent methyltransferase